MHNRTPAPDAIARAVVDHDTTPHTDTSVRVPLWSGVQPIAALWFAAELHTPEIRAQRMLAHWRTGAKALRFAEGDLLRFPEPRMAACETQPGLALCLDKRGTLTSALLRIEDLRSDDGVRALSTRPNVPGFYDVLLVHGARVLSLRQADGVLLDLSQWIDIEDYALHDTFDCSATLPTPDASRLAGRSVRDLLGEKIPPPSRERDAFLERLSEQAQGGRDTAGRTTRGRSADIGVGGATERLRAVGQDWLGRIISSVFGGLAAVGDATGTGGRATTNNGAGGLRQRQGPVAPSRWRDTLARLAIASRMSRLIGWRQGSYLRKMLQMFEDGDLQEALRHALPIDATGPSRGQAFSAPGRRADLRLSGASDVGTDIGLPDALREHLRTVYRQSFERLDRAGKIDEALFVLAELLNAKQEALDYLERHQRFAQAAELALAWDMPSATIVRLLLLAGDWERAVQVARRDGDFAAAISALEKTKPELAIKLRLAWGEALAERGQWLMAMETVWPIAQARNLAMHWLQAAEAAGETLSARALVRRAEHLPDTLERYGERLLALGEPEHHADARYAVADALLDVSKHNAATRAVASAILPALLADRAERRHDLSKAKLRKLLHLSEDPWLRADAPDVAVPHVAAKASFWLGNGGLRWDAPAVGLRTIYDVAVLDDHRYLVALGEAGAAVIDRRGRTIQGYAVPAYALAIGDSRNIALTVAPREALSRVSRLDLVHHTASDLGAIPIAFCANAFDGIGWSLVSRDRILVIDAAKSLQDVLWHVGDLPGPIVIARHSPTNELYLIRSGDAFEAWTYALPGRRLISRDRVEIRDDAPVMLYPHGQIVQPRIADSNANNDTGIIDIVYEWHRQPRHVHLRKLEGEVAPQIVCQALHQGMLLGLRGERQARYGLYRTWDGKCMAEFDWPASANLRVRETANALLIFDEEGRVLAIDSDGTLMDAISVR
jgi:tetratricopeptide (TPR) repeat protein